MLLFFLAFFFPSLHLIQSQVRPSRSLHFLDRLNHLQCLEYGSHRVSLMPNAVHFCTQVLYPGEGADGCDKLVRDDPTSLLSRPQHHFRLLELVLNVMVDGVAIEELYGYERRDGIPIRSLYRVLSAVGLALAIKQQVK